MDWRRTSYSSIPCRHTDVTIGLATGPPSREDLDRISTTVGNTVTDQTGAHPYTILLISLLSIGYVGFSLFVIICSNIPAISGACSGSLWVVVVTHLSIAIVFPLILCTGLIYKLEYETHYCTLTVLITGALMLLIVLFTLGIQFAYQDVTDPNCNAAMCTATSINSPMLAILSFINAGFDLLLFIISTWFCCCGILCL